MRKLSIFLSSFSLLFASACGEDGVERPVDLGVQADAGASAATQDAGVTVADAGTGSHEAGVTVASAGAQSTDAGAPSADAGATNQEAGASIGDAGGVSDALLDFPNAFSWTTGEFEVPAGSERYLCFASTLEEDLVANAFSTKGQTFVHHLIFSRSTANDKLGFEECDTAFRTGWQPMFITGAGSAKLELPSDAGHKLTKGTKIVIQMHLLNASEQPVKGKVSIQMRRSAHASPRPVSTYIFGSADVRLPANQESELKGECTMRERVKLIAGFPHMHMLGTAQRFEVGSAASMREVFKRDPYNFDAQSIEPLELELKSGDLTRVTCNFNNTLSQEVTYGESTKNEMCYFIGFAVDRPQQGACLGSLPPFF